MGDSARLRVDHQQSGEGNEIEQIAASPAQQERGDQQREQVAVGRQAEAEQPDREAERDDQSGRREDRRAAIQVLTRRAPLLGGLAVALAVLIRLPFWKAPLTADEGGYAEVARLWSHGATLYGGAWVDRPQGLIVVFRALHLVGGSPLAMRAAAAVIAALVVAATMLLTLRLDRGRITAVTAGLLAATVGASPFIESFTLSGELLASLPAVLSLLCFCRYLEGRERAGSSNRLLLSSARPHGRGWPMVRPFFASNRLLLSLAGAGALTGIALLIKQSAFDAGLAAIVYLLWRERSRGLVPAAVLVAGALVPVAIAAASATRLSAWVYAVVGYRFHGDSLLTGSLTGRAHQFWLSLPPAGKALGLLAVLAAVGWRRSPLLARIWLGAAVLGAIGGGNFHPHYYLQLVPPLSLLAAVGVRTLWLSAPRPAIATAGAAAAATLALAIPVAWANPTKQAQTIWPADPHLVHDAVLARYVRAHTRPRERILAIWADADLYYLADRRPAARYLWSRNVASIPGALEAVRHALATRRAEPVLVVQPPATPDPSGRTAALLRREYRRVARVGGASVYRSRSQNKARTTSPSSTK